MDGYGIPPSGPSARSRLQDLSSDDEEEQGVGFPAGTTVVDSDSEEEVAEEMPAKGKPKTAKSAIASRCSVNKMCLIVSTFDDEKKGIVEEMNFGGILHLQKLRQNRKFMMWLFDHVDEQASSIITGHHRDLPFCDKDIATVMGIPYGASAVCVPNHNVSDSVVAEIRRMFGISSTERKTTAMVEVLKKITLNL
jgi:hypothetical protein